MLQPKRTKYRKVQRGVLKWKAYRWSRISFWDYAIKTMDKGFITSRQIEAVRRTISRYTKRTGKIWIKVFPDKSVTARAEESRMGSGKGAVEYWVVVIKPGNILFEINGVTKEIAIKALDLARYKLPIKTKILIREESA